MSPNPPHPPQRPRPVRSRLHRSALGLTLAFASAHCAGKAFTDLGDGSVSPIGVPSDGGLADGPPSVDGAEPSDGPAGPAPDAARDASEEPDASDGAHDASEPPDANHDASPPGDGAVNDGSGHTGNDASPDGADGAGCAKPCGSTLCCTATEQCCDETALGGGVSCPDLGSVCPGVVSN